MPTRFELYLEACYTQAEIEEKAEILNSEITQCTREAGTCVDILLGQTPQLGKAGRILNNFPMEVTTNNETFRALDPVQKEKLITATRQLLSQLPDINGMEDLDEPPQHPAELIKQFNELFAKFMQVSCKELLDHQGQIKEGVVNSLHLNPVFHRFSDDKPTLAIIKDQLIFSFYSQIILSNFVTLFANDPQLINKINEFNMLAQSFVFKDGKFTPSFFNEIRHYLFKHSVPSIENWIRYVKAFTPETISELVTNDFFNLNHAQMINAELLETLRTKRIDFWLDVMLRLQKEPDYSLHEKEAWLAAIYKVSPAVQDKWNALPYALSIQEPILAAMPSSASSIPAATPASASSSASSSTQLTGNVVQEEAQKWLNYRDNNIILDFIMKDQVKQPSRASYFNPLRLFQAAKPVMTEDLACKNHLNLFYQNTVLLLLPTQDFFYIAGDTYEKPEQIIHFLEQYITVDMDFLNPDNPIYTEMEKEDWFGLAFMLCKAKTHADLKLKDTDWDILRSDTPKLLASFDRYLNEFDTPSKSRLLDKVISKNIAMGQVLAKILPEDKYKTLIHQFIELKVSLLALDADKEQASASSIPARP